MIEKRFVYYEYKGADYILDTPNTELDFIEMLGDALETEEIVDKLNELNDKIELIEIDKQNLHHLDAHNRIKILELRKENYELQERNNRQAKQLDDIYQLIEQKDYRALNDIMDDFKKAEEQLQSEWQTYEDIE